jgi:hypothetical protein
MLLLEKRKLERFIKQGGDNDVCSVCETAALPPTKSYFSGRWVADQMSALQNNLLHA